jgi:hypothetical protein
MTIFPSLSDDAHLSNVFMRFPRARRKTVHQLRPRRERFGELIQIDGSLHAWFEDRGPMCNPCAKGAVHT